MYWADEIAINLIEKNPQKEEFVCAAGISPSGIVHIGNFRDVATCYCVAKALKDKGKKVKFIFSWDDFDRFRKVPKGLDSSYSQYIGKPYTDIPDPEGCHGSYAEHFQSDFEESLKKFGIEVSYRYQTEVYLSGAYKEQVIHAVEKRKEIYDILIEFKTQDASDEERESFYPVNLYCSECGKDTTTIISDSDFGSKLEYRCKCNNHETVDLNEYFHVKLVWKVDWPMRWKYEEVDFEPGGKDHASVGGSYQVSSVIAREIFGIEPPFFQRYEFIGIKGATGKMSSSSGINLSPGEILKIYEPGVVLWLYAKTEPIKAFDFCFDERIEKQYFEFDKFMSMVKNGKADEHITRIYDFCRMEDYPKEPVSFSQLASFAPAVGFRPDALCDLFSKIGQDYTVNEINKRLPLVKYWLETYSPESIINFNESPNEDYYSTLADHEKSWVNKLYENLNNNDYSNTKEMQDMLYAISKLPENSDKENVKLQRRFFEIVYMLLYGKGKGPRLYLLLTAFDKKDYINLFNFT